MRGVLAAATAALLCLAQSPDRAAAADSALPVGATAQLRGTVNGGLVAVTLTKVVDPASGSDAADQASTGNRLVAAQFRIANIGTTTYDDAPDNDVQLIDTTGQSYQPTFDTIAAGQGFPGDVRITPGDSRLGYVVFEIPASTRTAEVQFVPDSGFSDDTATWDTPRATSVPHAAAADPIHVVSAYIAAINAGDYRTAWALGGKNFGGTYDDFAAGFASTAQDNLTIESTSGDTVRVRLDAEQIDGTHRVYTGSYTVHDGVIVAAHLARH